MKKMIFITGTDTHVGKTYITRQLLDYYRQQGLRTLGVKPIASGCEWQHGTLINEDALALSQASSINISYSLTNPFAFEQPVAPHIAAKLANITLNSTLLNDYFAKINQIDFDICLIEGAGGWLLPLNDHETFADVISALHIDIILVVSMKLGCLNHALLTETAIKSRGGKLAGWIANCVDPQMKYLNENIETLKEMLRAPMLGVAEFGGFLRLRNEQICEQHPRIRRQKTPS